MKYNKIVDIFKSKNIVIPMYIYKSLSKLDIDTETFIFLMYLVGNGEKTLFNINAMAEDFSCDVKRVMEYISILQSKKLISLEVIKNDKNITDEYISLSYFYEKLSFLLVDDINKTDDKDSSSSVFSILEKELGKTLTPIEYEIVKAWKENNYGDEIIEEAIREAVLNGVANLRYIDKVLYEWSKKGINTKEKVEKNRKEFRNREEKNQKIDIFEYDWMNDEERS